MDEPSRCRVTCKPCRWRSSACHARARTWLKRVGVGCRSWTSPSWTFTELVARASEWAAGVAAGHEVTLTCQCSPEATEHRVHGNQDALLTVFGNLRSNAIRYHRRHPRPLRPGSDARPSGTRSAGVGKRRFADMGTPNGRRARSCRAACLDSTSEHGKHRSRRQRS
jgi:hypothetical protein